MFPLGTCVVVEAYTEDAHSSFLLHDTYILKTASSQRLLLLRWVKLVFLIHLCIIKSGFFCQHIITLAPCSSVYNNPALCSILYNKYNKFPGLYSFFSSESPDCSIPAFCLCVCVFVFPSLPQYPQLDWSLELCWIWLQYHHWRTYGPTYSRQRFIERAFPVDSILCQVNN